LINGYKGKNAPAISTKYKIYERGGTRKPVRGIKRRVGKIRPNCVDVA